MTEPRVSTEPPLIPDAAYDERMDRVVKYARRIVEAERKAILEASAQPSS